MTPQLYTVRTPKRCDIKGCKKKAPHKIRVASSSTKRVEHLYYCDFHYADLYSGVFLGRDLMDDKKK